MAMNDYCTSWGVRTGTGAEEKGGQGNSWHVNCLAQTAGGSAARAAIRPSAGLRGEICPRRLILEVDSETQYSRDRPPIQLSDTSRDGNGHRYWPCDTLRPGSHQVRGEDRRTDITIAGRTVGMCACRG
jgi:hypothetical protein